MQLKRTNTAQEDRNAAIPLGLTSLRIDQGMKLQQNALKVNRVLPFGAYSALAPSAPKS